MKTDYPTIHLIPHEREKTARVYQDRQIATVTAAMATVVGHLDVLKEQRPFDLLDRGGDLDVSRAGVGAVENGPTSPDSRLGVENPQSLGRTRIATIENEPVGINDRRGSDEVFVCPRDWAGRGAGGAQDALRGVVVPLALCRAL